MGRVEFDTLPRNAIDASAFTGRYTGIKGRYALLPSEILHVLRALFVPDT